MLDVGDEETLIEADIGRNAHRLAALVAGRQRGGVVDANVHAAAGGHVDEAEALGRGLVDVLHESAGRQPPRCRNDGVWGTNPWVGSASVEKAKLLKKSWPAKLLTTVYWVVASAGRASDDERASAPRLSSREDEGMVGERRNTERSSGLLQA